MKYFRMSYDEIVNKRSYKTLLLLNASIPSFKSDKEEKEEGKRKRTDNNFKHANEILEKVGF